MNKRFCSALVVSILVRSIQLASSAETPPLIDRPNADSGPTEISVGMWVADISSIDSAQQTFTAEIAVVLRWKDPRLAHTGNGVVRYPREQIWHPRVGIMNETNSVSRKMPDSAWPDLVLFQDPSSCRRYVQTTSVFTPTAESVNTM